MQIRVIKKLFREEKFELVDTSVAGLADPFAPVLQGKYVIDENTGGGIKGLVSMLARFVHNKTCLPEYAWNIDNTNELWGNSTGGIIQALRALGKPEEEILRFYIELGPDVFHNLFGGVAFHGAMYSDKVLVKLLKKYFGDMTMKELHEQSGVDLHLIAFDITENKPLVINHDDYYGEDTSYFPVWVAVRATMSAPFFFRELVWFDPIKKKERMFWDGGLTGHNCSAKLAYEKAVNVTGLQDKDIQMLSVGTGMPDNGKPNAEKVRKLKKKLRHITKIKTVLNALLDANTILGLQQLKAYRDNDGLTFQRWNVALPTDLSSMDETDNINEIFNFTLKELRA